MKGDVNYCIDFTECFVFCGLYIAWFITADSRAVLRSVEEKT
jgi:hypothetical protein